ncbi:MAG TPA: amidase [Gammaproteobacteria bacterium]|nr:amidase [Gammaproteobacteria bacterium]
MPIPKPDAAEVAQLAARLGYRLSEEDAAQYASLMAGMLGGYDALEQVADDLLPVRHPRGAWQRPRAADNPHNAWYVRTSIKGAARGPLAGRRVAVKDSIMVAGVPMMNGASLLEGYVPAVDATVVTRVLDAGAEVVGKTHCEYFCLSGGSHTGAQGPVHNPHRHGWSSGGSSSGSAVVLVTGEADLALGADQGGSIRMPSSFSGTVGLKPTYGLVPYSGIAPIEGYMDHVGPMTMMVRDNALLLETIAGIDDWDPRQRAVPPVTPGCYTRDLDRGVADLRIGVLREGFGLPSSEADVDAKVRAGAALFAKLGARVEEVSVPMHALGAAIWTPIGIDGLASTVLSTQGFAYGRPDYYPVDMMEHLHERRARIDEVPPNVKLFTLLGRYVIERYGYTWYAKAANRVRRLRAGYDEALANFDLLLLPTTPMKAQPLPAPDCGLAEWVRRATEMLTNTCPTDVSHHPAISIPCGKSDGLPVGLMLIGRHFDEATIYRAAHAFEQTGVAQT